MGLINLHDFIENTINEFDFEFFSQDRVLPEAFKSYVKNTTGGDKYKFLDYTTIVKSELSIYCPNQWFYIAAYYCKLYPVLQQYKEAVYENAKLPESLKDYQAFFASVSGDFEKAKASLADSALSESDIELVAKFMSDYAWWKGGKGIERNDFFYSPILASARLVNQSQAYVADICKYLVNNPEALKILQGIIDTTSQSHTTKEEGMRSFIGKQVVYYGAPGTGKSFSVNNLIKNANHVRTIFHPDSDYASFVGCYKPVMEDGKIVYKYMPQAFVNAYINAWLSNEPYYLIIEEINRGNCAQIFGDIFQLLDRSNGESEYEVYPDTDLQNYIKQTFATSEIIQLIADKGLDIPTCILSGEVMLLPKNLSIIATMNTSDQSLFPMDSAFKRRWDWKYFSIKDEKKGFVIKVDDGHEYDWWKTISILNDKILNVTKSADKQIGYWFAKIPQGETVITADKFVSKVVFYLWNDVFKDYGFSDNNPFTRETTFDAFFDNSGEIVKETLLSFLERINPSTTE